MFDYFIADEYRRTRGDITLMMACFRVYVLQ